MRKDSFIPQFPGSFTSKPQGFIYKTRTRSSLPRIVIYIYIYFYIVSLQLNRYVFGSHNP
jgi:hypothetical protein